jgi:hypothetical protein
MEEQTSPPKQTEQPKQEEKDKTTVKEIHHHHYRERSGFNFGRLAIGLILVFIGLIYLIQANGWINMNINFDWWKLWPLIIVIIGLSMLSGRGWLSGVIGIIVLMTILVIVGLLIFSDNAPTVTATEKTIAIAKEATATSATIDIKAGAGTLKVGSGTDQLVAGTFKSNVTSLTTNTSLDNARQTVTLKEDNYTWRSFGNRINDLAVSLLKDTPIKLIVSAGAIDMNLNLADLTAESVDINTGASSIKLELGDKVAASTLSISAGVSSLAISLPRTLGAHLNIESGFSTKDLPDFQKIDDKNYATANYGSAEKKIDITLKMGGSSIKVNWR